MENQDCFVIMPISETDNYDKGHFKKVYECIFKPAIIKAGFIPKKADEIRETNFIHLDILQRLLKSPMAICDLSNQNPNVMFELGLRQAFDMPVVLVQEKGNKQIFDIGPLRYTEYDSSLGYLEVLEDQSNIYEAICATKLAFEKNQGMNSLVNLLSISRPAALKDINESNISQMFQLLVSEIGYLRSDVQRLKSIDSLGKSITEDEIVKNFLSKEDEYSLEIINEIEDELKEIKIDLANNIPANINRGKFNRLRSKILGLRNGASSKETRDIADYLFQKMNDLSVEVLHDQGP